jgi:uncharacterized protein (DUF58 family)
MSALELPADLRSRLRRLSLRPLRHTRGAGFGLHAGRTRGAGVDFAQYRAYQQGDDLRRIDWRLYARSDHFFVREAERESPTALWIVLDTSASMTQADEARPGWSRLEAAKRLAAALIAVALKDGDSFGLALVGPEAALATRIGQGVRHRDQVFSQLARVRAAGAADWRAGLERLGERFAPHDLVLVLSDGFDEACLAALERLAAAGRDIGFMQLLTVEEREFPFSGGRLFEDPETGARLQGEGRAMRARFLDRFAQARAAQAARLRACGVRRVEHFIDESADLPIAAMFAAAERR